MMRKAFTLIELVVALGILAVILSFAGVIFRVSVESQQMAIANAEIMQKLRVITEQLDADLKGGVFRDFQYPYRYGGYLCANLDTLPDRTDRARTITANSDGIIFFAGGDFRSTGQYGNPVRTIAGNVACIFYGQPDPNSYAFAPEPREKLLLRRQTILAVSGPAGGSDPRGEYCTKLPQEWFVDANDWVRRPVVATDSVQPSLYYMYVAQGVDDFTIEYVDASTQQWTGTIPWVRPAIATPTDIVKARALKFMFTLYDSKGILKKGRMFTHIVVWDNG
jgi:prepilin-type N-terminal cleavage/methylation domain-containing protein